ncbi:MAG: hypothetical protein HY426_01575 [Candidatus Levybacteria bacterium]|nr:hypothetical protein [Candidatus Levybacteria bacterium]
MAKKKSSSRNNLTAANAVISFLVLLLAFSILLLFRNYKDTIISSGNFNGFLVLVTLGFALLISLLFLINNSKK